MTIANDDFDTIEVEFSIPNANAVVGGEESIHIIATMVPGIGTSSYSIANASDVDSSGATNGQVLVFNGSTWVPQNQAVGVTDHGSLTGLEDDDHPQYFNQSRGDARYPLNTDPRLSNARTPTVHSHTESDISDLDKYSQSQVDNLLAGKAAASHTHTKADITDFNESAYATAAQGVKADSALQALPSNAIVEGDVRLSNARTPTAHTHLESDITNLDKYTQAQVDALVGARAIRDGAETLTGAKVFSDGATFGGDVAITGNFTIGGVGTTSIGNEVQTGDNKLLLNADEAGTPTLDVGIEAERGTQTNAELIWNETLDKWVAGLSGSLQALILDNDPRLTDSRTPLAHTHVKADITDFSDADYATASQGTKADSALQDLSGSVLNDLSNVSGTPSNNQVLTWIGSGWIPQTITSGVTDHGALSGLADDDHTQYHTDARGDARYYLKSQVDSSIASVQTTANTAANEAGQALILANDNSTAITNLSSTVSGKEDSFAKQAGFNKPFGTIAGTVAEGNDARFTDARTPTAHTHTESDITDLDKYTQAEVNTALAGKANTSHTHAASDITSGQFASARISATSVNQHSGSINVRDLADVSAGGITTGQVLVWNDSLGRFEAATQSSGVTDHGLLSGLNDDDHTQYHTDARGDARYYTQAQVTSQLATKANSTHTHTESDITDLDKYTQSEVDTLVNGREAAFSKNTGFNKAFGSTAGTVVEGNDSRLSDSRTPLAHTHTKADITDFSDGDYATSAQGALADSALQSVTLDSATDVDTSGKTDGQVLAWNNASSSWEAVDQSGGTSFNGGTVTENIEIDRADANSIIDASTGTPRVTMNRVGVKTFEIQGLSNRTLLRRYHETGGGQNRFEMYDDSTRFDHEVRGVDATNPAGFVTLSQVQALIAAG